MLRDTFSYHNFSWRGDPRWADASPITLRAPVVVVILLLLSIAQISLGSVWIVAVGEDMTVFAIVYLVSSIVLLASCTTSTSTSNALRRTECPQGTSSSPNEGVSKSVWDAMVTTSLLSAALYACHAGMAVYVKKVIKRKKEAGIEEAVDPAQEEARAQKARDLWVKATSQQGL
ncbi:hypothetical protein MMC22_009880 [Lobaria immixta]|nr:hypothetical protein [Lobaria immixta]